MTYRYPVYKAVTDDSSPRGWSAELVGYIDAGRSLEQIYVATKFCDGEVNNDSIPARHHPFVDTMLDQMGIDDETPIWTMLEEEIV